MGLAAGEVPPELHLPEPCLGRGAFREDQAATECSSSFGFTDSGSEDDSAPGASTEVESAARDGNGVLLADTERRPLNLDWRNYRRGIEWRCRWISIRLMKLLRQASKYDEVLAGIQNARPWNEGAEASAGAARTAAMLESRPSRPLLHRQRRKKVEETLDAAEYMSRHPLFQRYEKKKRDLEGDQHKEQNDLAADGGTLPGAEEEDQDSVENLMLKVEKLQARVVRLRNQLRGSMSHKFPGSVARAGGAATSKAAGVRLPKASSNTHHASPAAAPVGKSMQTPRRRASDFDINNVVMPVSVGTKYVQHVRHVNIETPQWRLAEKVEMREDESSGYEDTDEDAYRSHHAPMETQEKFNRYGPKSNKKAGEAAKSSAARSSGSSSKMVMPQCTLSSQYTER